MLLIVIINESTFYKVKSTGSDYFFYMYSSNTSTFKLFSHLVTWGITFHLAIISPQSEPCNIFLFVKAH